MHFKISILLLLASFIVLVCCIVTQDKPTKKQRTSLLQTHQTKKSSPYYRQSPQKCDLICPGVPPLALPPNFANNCSSTANNSTQHTGNSTSPKPGTTTESGEGDETEESAEESAETSTKKSSGTTKKQTNRRHPKSNSQVRKKTQSEQYQLHQNKKHIRKEKILLKREVKKQLYKHNKQFKGRSRLDGCYVVCAEGNESSRPGNPGNQGYGIGGTNTDEPGSEESEEDNYIPGEDNPIEIIYMPQSTKGNQRPVDLYQTNNYAFLEPQPVFGYDFDPFFMEGKHKKIKKRKQKDRKKENNKIVDRKINLPENK